MDTKHSTVRSIKFTSNVLNNLICSKLEKNLYSTVFNKTENNIIVKLTKFTGVFFQKTQNTDGTRRKL